MTKTCGSCVRPTEVEEVLYATCWLGEFAAFGVDRAVLGQAIGRPPADAKAVDGVALLAECKARLPICMVPHRLQVADSLSRNPNGKIDRKLLAAQWVDQQG